MSQQDDEAVSSHFGSRDVPEAGALSGAALRIIADAEYFSMLEAIGQSTEDVIIIIDAQGHVVYGNPVAEKVFGVRIDDVVGTQARLYLHPDDLERNLSFFAEVLAKAGTSARQDLRTMAPTGDVRTLEVVCTNLLDDPSIHGVIINGRDVTERNDNYTRLAALEERFRLAFEENMAPMTFADADDRILAANDAFCEMIGFSRDELIGRDSTPFTHPDDVGVSEATHQRVVSGYAERVRYVKRYLRKDGQVIDVEVSRSPARDADGRLQYFVFSERDVTEERKLTAQLSHQALYDAITGLANRTLLETQLTKARANVKRRGGLNALFLLDLDDFKGVNDTQGHLVGDQLLIGVARRFEAVTRPSDTLCRFGGDEFLYLAEGLRTLSDVEGVARRLLAALTAPFHFPTITIEQRATVGIVVWDGDSADDVDLLQNVDVALYEAKRRHRGSFVLYEPSMREEANNRFTMIQELRNSLAHGELQLHYQPIVRLPDTTVVGFEGLIRWQHPERGWVAPNEFIPLAERSDIIFDIGALAIDSAVAAASTWARDVAPATSPFICVNLSARQFYSPLLVPLIESALARHGLEGSQLVLEITEGVAVSNFGETLNTLDRLERLGVGISLDDFGTGFSSLSYLAKINPRIIKVDQSFVQLASSSTRDATLLEAIVTLGRNLDITMLAEGIETPDQFRRLVDLGCNLAQGFLFSPAVEASRARRLVGGDFATHVELAEPASTYSI
ncbi:MAG: EAL domain-containing protein [Acidobacteria bacterium]|nr:EAL domain-containing protein [Acidobacteriota bacterium]